MVMMNSRLAGKTAPEKPEAKCNEYHYGRANAAHRQRSYGCSLQDLLPPELSPHHSKLQGRIATI